MCIRDRDEIASKVAEDDALSSVTTGFGLLNEPDAGIDYWRMLHYYEDAYATIRRVLGKDVAVYVGDMYNAVHKSNSRDAIDASPAR